MADQRHPDLFGYGSLWTCVDDQWNEHPISAITPDRVLVPCVWHQFGWQDLFDLPREHSFDRETLQRDGRIWISHGGIELAVYTDAGKASLLSNAS